MLLGLPHALKVKGYKGLDGSGIEGAAARAAAFPQPCQELDKLLPWYERYSLLWLAGLLVNRTDTSY